MRYLKILGVMGFMLSATVWAADGSKPVPASSASLQQARQRLERHEAEVRRLEQDVDRQESDSKQASERLKLQDQTLAELRKQLAALHDQSSTRQH